MKTEKEIDAQVEHRLFIGFCSAWLVLAAAVYFENQLIEVTGAYIFLLWPILVAAFLALPVLLISFAIFRSWKWLACVIGVPSLTGAALATLLYSGVYSETLVCGATEFLENLTAGDSSFRPRKFACGLRRTYEANQRKPEIEREHALLQSVVEAIPVGTPFNIAEERLRQAGFRVNSKPPAYPPGGVPGDVGFHHERIVASLSLGGFPLFFAGVGLNVYLYPKKANEFDYVFLVETGFF